MSDGSEAAAVTTPLPEPPSNAGGEASPRRAHSAEGAGAARKAHHCSRIRSCSWKKAHLKIGGVKKQCQRGIGRLLALAQVGIVAKAAGDKIPRDSQRASFTAQTVASVRASLEAKRMKHIRRGNYQRYSPELREEIAKHAISHGISQTTKHFSSTPGAKPISESTVRNFVRAYCSPASHLASCLRNKDLGEEIGKFAACAGTEAAVRYYSSRLGMEVKRGTVGRLRHAYLKKHSPPEEGQLHKRKGMEMSRRKRRYGALLRDEIGNYAAQHGVRAAVQHYSERLLFPVRERTIAKFLKMYVEKESDKSPESPCELNRSASLLEKSFPPTTHPHQEHESIPPPTNALSSPANVLDDEGPASLVVYGSYATGLSAQQQGIGYHHDSGLPTYEIHSTGPTIILDQSVANTGFCHSHDLGYDQSVQDFSTNFNPEVNPGVSSASVESLGMDHHNASGSGVAMSHEAMGTTEHVSMTHMPSTYVGAMMGIPHHHHLMGEAQGNGMLNAQVIVGEHTSSAQSGNNAAATLVSSNNLMSMLPASSFVQHAKSQVLMPSSSSLIGQGDGDGSMLANPTMTSLQKTMDGDIMPPYYPLTLTTTPAYQMGNSDMSASIEIAKETTGEICTGSETLILGESLMSDPPLESQNSKSNQKEMLCVSSGVDGKPSCYIEATQCRDAERHGAMVGGESVEVGTTDFLGTVHLEEENLSQSTTVTEKKGSEKKPLPSKAAKKKAKCPQKSKRGNYIFLSPELRARIGRYAAEHGNLKTAKHFEAEVGRQIPESTIRGLRDKFVMKQMHVTSAQSSEGSSGRQVTALGYAPRGRPMVLGKYDEVVQDCMHELVKGGEKVGSSLAIATARQVLTQYEPSLLEEFGGPIKLNNSWAKSFIKRIGLSRNS